LTETNWSYPASKPEPLWYGYSRCACRLDIGTTRADPGTPLGRAPTTKTATHDVKNNAAHDKNVATGTADCGVTRAVLPDSGSSCHPSKLTCSARCPDVGVTAGPIV
jgi:hypothetical protein